MDGLHPTDPTLFQGAALDAAESLATVRGFAIADPGHPAVGALARRAADVGVPVSHASIETTLNLARARVASKADRMVRIIAEIAEDKNANDFARLQAASKLVDMALKPGAAAGGVTPEEFASVAERAKAAGIVIDVEALEDQDDEQEQAE